MLNLKSGDGAVINTDNFYITHKTSGIDELVFDLSINDPAYPKLLEESVIEYEQEYLIKAVDAGANTAKIKCQLNLDEWKEAMYPAYSNNSATLADTMEGILPKGWIFIDNAHSKIRRTIEGGYTPYDIALQCQDTYSVAMRFDVKKRQVQAYDLDAFEPLGAFATRELNLKEINYKGKSTEFYTRLYAYGKNGLSFADINGGKPYVENFQYTDKIISAYWSDERYEVPENLLEDAKEAVKKASVPERSYECTVMDLAKTNPEKYGFQDFQLFSVIRLIDDVKELSILYQVVEYQEYPYYPEKNVVTLSSTAPKIQDAVKSIQYQITDKNSSFWNVMNNAIASATDWITGVNGGYVVMHKDENDVPYEILIMDKPDIETATKVWRWNMGGLGYSKNGYNGPYELAMTIDGAIVANFITAGTMLADRIKGGTLILGGKDNGNGVAKILDADGNEVLVLDKNGAYAKGRYISISKDGTKRTTVNAGQISVAGEDGATSGIISYLNNGITMQSYGGEGSSVVCRRDGTTQLWGPNGNSIIGGIRVPGGYTGKSGRAEFSDGSYLRFVDGICIGGETKEGGAF